MFDPSRKTLTCGLARSICCRSGAATNGAIGARDGGAIVAAGCGGGTGTTGDCAWVSPIHVTQTLAIRASRTKGGNFEIISFCNRNDPQCWTCLSEKIRDKFYSEAI